MSFDVTAFTALTKPVLIELCEPYGLVDRATRRNKSELISRISTLEEEPLIALTAAATAANTGKRKRPDKAGVSAPRKKGKYVTAAGDEEQLWDETQAFPAPSADVVLDCISQFIDGTSNEALAVAVCVVCARELARTETSEVVVRELPNTHLLIPTKSHPAHDLFHGVLVHRPAMQSNGEGRICTNCLSCLQKNKRPPFALSNGMWVGEMPLELSVLTLPERILVARYYSAAYVVKLYPKKKGACYWDTKTMHSALRGNVSTYRLNTQDVVDIATDRVFPPPMCVLAATIGITFVGPTGLPERTLPDFFRVRRARVGAALVWLKKHNPLYADIEICPARLGLLPVDAIPDELFAVTKYSSDTALLASERAGYVPEDENEHHSGLEPESRAAGVTSMDEDEHEMVCNDPVDAAVIPIQALGVVDVAGNDVPDEDLFAHALLNTTGHYSEDYTIRRSSAFVNEYPREDRTTGQRSDGGPSDPNHLLGCFPELFPYGVGGFEVDRVVPVPYEKHARWALQYADRRFRKHLHFVFQVFGVIQKRQVCRSACLQLKRSSFAANEALLSRLSVADLKKASGEETRRVCFSNPGVQSLRSQLSAVRAKVQGTDESRTSIRAQIWSTTLLKNPPSIWLTINPADTHDPVAQVFTGSEIDMDHFNQTDGPDATGRASNVAGDPYAAAKFFHFTIKLILETLMGITMDDKKTRIHREDGILGRVSAYIGTVEAQGRGTLHLHMVLWLESAPTAGQMKEALRSAQFRERLAQFIKSTIRADLDGVTASDLAKMPRQNHVSYSRPVDPRSEQYAYHSKKRERDLARAVQLHQCTVDNCLKIVKGHLRCKRRAPFPLSSEDWINQDGNWGPRRTCGYLNNWNFAVLQTTRANHDIKLITNGEETKDISFYITNYVAKKQTHSSNTSALLAKRFAYHQAQEAARADWVDANKRLLQRCANSLSRLQELSAPEVVSYLMGWGDRYLSHHYVPIYWDGAVAALKQFYPTLRKKKDYMATLDTGGETRMEPRDDYVRVEVVDNKILMRDQLKEYTDRGDALHGYSFLDYFLDTYDGEEIKPSPAVDCEKRAGGRPRSIRFPYQASSGRTARCRIVRQCGHETLPHIVGQWFPKNNDADCQELYCASILLLLKPWNNIGELRGGETSFANAFDQFIFSANGRTRRVIENIQYYHECSEKAAKSRQQEDGDTGGILDMDIQAGAQVVVNDEAVNLRALDEGDVDIARRGSWAANEVRYGNAAMEVAKNVGVFDETPVHLAFNKPARTATMDDIVWFAEWEGIIKTFSRRQHDEEKDGGGAVQHLNVTLQSQAEAVVEHCVRQTFGEYNSTRLGLQCLKQDQRFAHDIVAAHLLENLAGRKPPQLLMIVQGQAGTGKTTLTEQITETFSVLGVQGLLGKTATTGVAATLIGGQTLHSWAGIPRKNVASASWVSSSGREVKARRVRNITGRQYLIIDEYSMLTKGVTTSLSDVLYDLFKCDEGDGSISPFGGMHIIMSGDFHQFPPVPNPHAALYETEDSSVRGKLGRHLYEQFTTVVELREQIRVTDVVWNTILGKLREGACDKNDLQEVRKLLLTNAECNRPDFTVAPWNGVTLVTPRHAVRVQWNAATARRQSLHMGTQLYAFHAEDTAGSDRGTLSLPNRVTVAGMRSKETGGLEEIVELAVGMKVMITENVATEADLANGTRGEIVGIVLDARDEPANTGVDSPIELHYPPAVVFFKPSRSSFPKLANLEEGVLPVFPKESSFFINGKKTGTKITRRQVPMTAAYAFTDYKSQGQTLEHVIVDLAKPARGVLTSFNAYVALSRSRGRSSIRLLREFENALFTTHPSRALEIEDIRLRRLAELTRAKKLW